MKISISRKKEETISKTITIEGEADRVDRILRLLRMLSFNSDIGHTGVFGIFWDGDGSDKIKISGLEDVSLESIKACVEYGGYAEIIGENGSSFVIRDGINGHYISPKKVYPKEASESNVSESTENLLWLSDSKLTIDSGTSRFETKTPFDSFDFSYKKSEEYLEKYYSILKEYSNKVSRVKNAYSQLISGIASTVIAELSALAASDESKD